MFRLFLITALALQAAEPFRWIERPFPAPFKEARSFAEAPDGSLTVATSVNIYRFDGKLAIPLNLPLGPGAINNIAYLASGELIIVSDDGVHLWNGRELNKIDSGHAFSIAVIDGRILTTRVPAEGRPYLILLEKQTDNRWLKKESPNLHLDTRFSNFQNRTGFAQCAQSLCKFTLNGTGIQSDELLQLPPNTAYANFLTDSMQHLWAFNYHQLTKINTQNRRTESWPIDSFRHGDSGMVERDPGEVCYVNGSALVCRLGAAQKSYPIPATPKGIVHRTYRDRHGIIWLAIDNFGLIGLARASNIEEYGPSEGLAFAPFSFIRTTAGEFLAGTARGIFKFQPSSGRWLRFDQSPIPLRYWRLLDAGQGRFLASQIGKSIDLFSSNGTPLQSWSLPKPQPAGYRTIARGPQGQIHFASAGLFELNPNSRNSTPQSIPLPREGLVKDLAWTPDQRLALTYQGGLAIGQPGAWLQIDERDGLRDAALESLAIAPNSNIFWVSYDNGLGFARVELEAGKKPSIRNFGQPEGFDDNRTYDLMLDRNGQLWRGTSTYIALSDGTSLEPRNWQVYNTSIGLTNPDVSSNSMFEDTDGSIWVGTLGGAVHFSKSATQLQAKQPLHAFVQKLEAEPALRLSHRYLLSPTMPHFEYRFAGQWLPVANDQINLGSLPSGNHNIEVRIAPSRFFEPANVTIVPVFIPSPPLSKGLLLWLTLALSMLLVVLWSSRHHLLALIPSKRLLLWQQRRLFLHLKTLRDEDAKDRVAELPAPLRKSLASMLTSFNLIEDSQDERTRSGIVLDSRYLLEHVIAKGGFATVYIAQDLAATRTVAVKLFHSPIHEGTWLKRRLEAEIEAMQRVNHPSVVRLLAHGIALDARPYLVMEYINGITLRQALRNGPLDLPRCLDRIDEASAALEAVHSLGILHRDLKPENIILSSAGLETERAILIDFGVASVYDSIRDGAQSTFFAGSLDYVAPEQIAGLRTQSSDVYALALILFELLTNRRFKLQFAGEPTIEAIEAQLRSVAGPQTETLATCIFQASALEHSRRTATIAAFRATLATVR